jgi:hypothetical protein
MSNVVRRLAAVAAVISPRSTSLMGNRVAVSLHHVPPTAGSSSCPPPPLPSLPSSRLPPPPPHLVIPIDDQDSAEAFQMFSPAAHATTFLSSPPPNRNGWFGFDPSTSPLHSSAQFHFDSSAVHDHIDVDNPDASSSPRMGTTLRTIIITVM